MVSIVTFKSIDLVADDRARATWRRAPDPLLAALRSEQLLAGARRAGAVLDG
jgi:hypothetical protein